MNRWNIFALLLLLFLISFLYLYIRKLYAVRKIKAMSVSEKLERINQVSFPLGFEYILSQDLFTSKIDAWQKDCGYCGLYDRTAPLFHMIFDCEPIYFDYGGSTWMIELWKGQYGITAGCEIGIYRAEGIVPESQRRNALFLDVPKEQRPVFSVMLFKNGLRTCYLCRKHWWLTSFHVGQYAAPENLEMKVTITFPDPEMCRAFITGLEKAGYLPSDIYANDTSAAFTFSVPRTGQPFLRRSGYHRWILFKNRVLLFFYLQITSPFCFTLDRLLLLYEFLPVLFRHILKIRRIRKPRPRKREE